MPFPDTFRRYLRLLQHSNPIPDAGEKNIVSKPVTVKVECDTIQEMSDDFATQKPVSDGATGSTPPQSKATAQRRRGRRPADAQERRTAVEQAIAELTAGGIPFSMGDVAERAGISRATLYRDAGLRDLVGMQGNEPNVRPVTRRELEILETKVALLTKEQRRLKRELRVAEERARVAEERVTQLTDENYEYEKAARKAARDSNKEAMEQARKEAYAEGFKAGVRATGRAGGTAVARATGDLNSVATRFSKDALLNARRTLVRALHPDLFAQDPAAQLIATELLKQINVLTQT